MELSHQLGLSDNSIAKIESGVRPSMETFRKFADFFEVPIEYLVSETDDGATPWSIQNPELLEVFQNVDKMAPNEQRLVLDVVNVLVQKDQLQRQLGRRKKGE